jgi:hypothetical protein
MASIPSPSTDLVMVSYELEMFPKKEVFLHFEVLFWNLPVGTEGLGIILSRQRFEPGTSKIFIQSIINVSAIFLV